MTVVTVASMKVVDGFGKDKSVPVYFAQTATLAAIQSAMDDFMLSYDALADAQVIAASVNLQLTLPGGLKSVPIVGSRVNIGANVTFDVNESNFVHTIFMPAIRASKWSGDVLTSGAELDALTDALQLTRSEEGNTLIAFLYSSLGKRK